MALYSAAAAAAAAAAGPMVVEPTKRQPSGDQLDPTVVSISHIVKAGEKVGEKPRKELADTLRNEKEAAYASVIPESYDPWAYASVIRNLESDNMVRFSRNVAGGLYCESELSLMKYAGSQNAALRNAAGIQPVRWFRTSDHHLFYVSLLCGWCLDILTLNCGCMVACRWAR